jgi:hypothetical protein
MTERRTDRAAPNRIDEIAAAYRRFNRLVTWPLRAGVAMLFVAGVLFSYQLAINADRAHQIQAERARSVRDNCTGTNERHDSTVATVDRVLITAAFRQFRDHVDERARMGLERAAAEAQHASPGRLVVLLGLVKRLVPERDDRLIDESRGQTVLLVDALAPHRDCDLLVRRQVGR